MKAITQRSLAAGIISTLLAVTLSLPAGAETLKVEGLEFDRILVKGSVQVQIMQGDDNLLMVKGQEGKLEKKPFYVSDGTLVLGQSREKHRENFSRVKYKLSTPNIEHVELNGSGDVYVRPFKTKSFYGAVEGSGDIKLFSIDASDDVTLQLSGSGDIKVAELNATGVALVLSGSGDLHLQEMEAKDTDASLNGSGDMSVQGKGYTERLQINIVGSGDIDFRAMDAEKVEVNIVGSGVARVGESESLDVSIMGSGDVRYSGRPSVDQSVMGSGSVGSAD